MGFFEKSFDGLASYEAALLMLGVLLFITVLGLLITFAVQKRSMKPLLYFFGVSVLMLVWPSVQKIKIQKDAVELEKLTTDETTPATAEEKAKIETAIENLESKGVEDPDVKKNIAVAQYRVGDVKSAEKTISSLPPTLRKDPSILNIRSFISASKELEDLIAKAKANPRDRTVMAELKASVDKAKALRNPPTDLQKLIAEAEALLRRPLIVVPTDRTERILR